MSRRIYDGGVLVEEWDDDTRIYRRYENGAVALARGYTDAEIAGVQAVPLARDDPGNALVGAVGRTYKIVAGVIRNAGPGSGYWQPINDAGHQPTHIDSASTSPTAITVSHPVGATKIATFVAVPDETLTAAGFAAGVSVDLAVSRIYLTRRESAVNPQSVDTTAFPGSNIWIFGVFEA